MLAGCGQPPSRTCPPAERCIALMCTPHVLVCVRLRPVPLGGWERFMDFMSSMEFQRILRKIPENLWRIFAERFQESQGFQASRFFRKIPENLSQDSRESFTKF